MVGLAAPVLLAAAAAASACPAGTTLMGTATVENPGTGGLYPTDNVNVNVGDGNLAIEGVTYIICEDLTRLNGSVAFVPNATTAVDAVPGAPAATPASAIVLQKRVYRQSPNATWGGFNKSDVITDGSVLQCCSAAVLPCTACVQLVRKAVDPAPP